MLDADPPASSIIFVSAFVSVQTIMQVKRQILGLKESDSDIRFVFGRFVFCRMQHPVK